MIEQFRGLLSLRVVAFANFKHLVFAKVFKCRNNFGFRDIDSAFELFNKAGFAQWEIQIAEIILYGRRNIFNSRRFFLALVPKRYLSLPGRSARIPGL